MSAASGRNQFRRIAGMRHGRFRLEYTTCQLNWPMLGGRVRASRHGECGGFGAAVIRAIGHSA